MRRDIELETSSRTTSPKRRRWSSSSTASSRSSASSETSKSASRVTRKTARSTISIPGKSSVEEVRDHVLERDEARLLAERHEAGRRSGNLDPREPLLAGLRVAREHAEAERETRDVRERLARADAERREDGEHLAREPPLELRRSLPESASMVVIEMPASSSAGRSFFRQSCDWASTSSSDPLSDRRERLARGQAVDGADGEPRRRLPDEPGDADHEELVEVRREEAAHAHPLEQGERVVGGELEQPRVVLDRRELAVEQTTCRLRLACRRHRLIFAADALSGGYELVSIW